MRKLILSLLLGAISLSLTAQKPPIKFGDISKEELSMTTYDKDTTAPAVVLADYGESSMVYRQNIGFTLDFDRITRIKVLTKDGLTWGDFSIPLYKSGSSEEKLTGLKAVTYNLEDGKVVESKLKNEGIFREDVDLNHDLVKLTCPNVREGSIVEISYKVNSPFLGNFQDWSFQTTIPIVISEYRAQIPEWFHYDRYMQGYVRLNVADETRAANAIRLTSFERSGGRVTQSKATTDQVEYMDVKYRWVANHVPAFKPEPFMTSLHDYVTKINFELASVKFPNEPVKNYMGSWQDINKTFSESEHITGQITGNGFLKKIAEEVTTGMSSPDDKIAAICAYVKQNVMWDGSQRMYAALPLKKVLENKKGNSAEINLLLGAMLEKVDVEVLPVLLSTRNHGLLRIGTPVSSQFNYLICLARAGERSYLLDATERLLPTGMLPERCLNGKGFAVSKAGYKWIPLESNTTTRRVTSGEFILSPNGALDGKLKLDCSGYAALENRKKYLIDGETEYLKDFIGSHAWEIKSTEIQNAKEIQHNFTQIHELEVSENMVIAGGIIYLDPFIHNAHKENPFKSEIREYPVDFGSPSEETFFFKLTIPEGYVVDELPESKAIAMPESGARYVYNIVQNGNQIMLTRRFHINKSLFTQVEYPYLREFYNQIVAKESEQIVLKKQ